MAREKAVNRNFRAELRAHPAKSSFLSDHRVKNGGMHDDLGSRERCLNNVDLPKLIAFNISERKPLLGLEVLFKITQVFPSVATTPYIAREKTTASATRRTSGAGC